MADKTVDKIVAIVNQDVITLYDLDRAMAPMLAEIRKAPNFDAAYSEAKQKTLEQLIDDALLKQEIDKAKIEVDENELARAIAGVLAQNRITIDMLRSELASKGISFESYKKQLADQIRRMKFIQQNVSAALHISEEEIDSFLKEQQKESEAITVRLEQWRLPLRTGLSQRELGREIRKNRKVTDGLRKGKTPREKDLQHDTVGPKLLSELPIAVAQAARGLEVGAVSDPIAMVDQIVIVKLLDKQVSLPVSKTMSRAQAGDILYTQRMEQALTSYLTKLRQKSYIDVRE